MIKVNVPPCDSFPTTVSYWSTRAPLDGREEEGRRREGGGKEEGGRRERGGWEEKEEGSWPMQVEGRLRRMERNTVYCWKCNNSNNSYTATTSKYYLDTDWSYYSVRPRYDQSTPPPPPPTTTTAAAFDALTFPRNNSDGRGRHCACRQPTLLLHQLHSNLSDKHTLPAIKRCGSAVSC